MTRSRILQPVTMCGRMCYSLYLMHWLVCVTIGHILLNVGLHSLHQVLWITVPILFVLSIAASWVFYMLVERHFLNTPNVPVKPIALPMTISLARPALG